MARHFNSTYGSPTKKVELTKLRHAFDIFIHSLKKPGVSSLAEDMTDGHGKLSLPIEFAKSIVGMSNHTLPLIICALVEQLTTNEKVSAKYVKLGEELRRELHTMLGDNAVFLFPTHPEVSQPLS